MLINKWLKEKRISYKLNQKIRSTSTVRKENKKQECNSKSDETMNDEELVVVYLTNDLPSPTIISNLQSINEKETKVS